MRKFSFIDPVEFRSVFCSIVSKCDVYSASPYIESSAKKFFSNEKNVIVKTVRIDNRQDYVVSGVVKNLPENSTLRFEWLGPYEIANAKILAKGGKSDGLDWGSYGPFTYVELSKNASVSAINQRLKFLFLVKLQIKKVKCFYFQCPNGICIIMSLQIANQQAAEL